MYKRKVKTTALVTVCPLEAINVKGPPIWLVPPAIDDVRQDAKRSALTGPKLVYQTPAIRATQAVVAAATE